MGMDAVRERTSEDIEQSASLRTMNLHFEIEKTPNYRDLSEMFLAERPDNYLDSFSDLMYSHNINNLEYSRAMNCWVQKDVRSVVPKTYVLGDRMFHVDYASDVGDFELKGSTSNHWHGFNFGMDFSAAIRWLHQANYKELGYHLWGYEKGVTIF